MLKNLYEQLYRLIYRPAKSWEVLAGEKENIKDNESFFKSYLYPVIGIVALLAFIGVFFHQRNFDIQLALKLTIRSTIALFAGFYMASYILSEVMVRYFSKEKCLLKCQRFVGYSSALVYVIYMVLAFFPDSNFLLLFSLYSIYMIWEGAIIYMGISDEERSKFSMVAAAIILLSPIVIERIMFLFMPGMRT